MDKLRIVITDDHTVLRSGLKMLLESQNDMEVVGEAFDAPSALLAIQEQPRRDDGGPEHARHGWLQAASRAEKIVAGHALGRTHHAR